MRTPSNSDNVIDSRDIIKRMAELRDELDSLISDFTDAETPEEKEEAREALEAWLGLATGEMDGDTLHSFTGDNAELKDWGRSDDAEELLALQNLADEGEGSSDWRHGETLIRESYFEDYARGLHDDMNGSDKGDGWPYNCIDWERAARGLQQDYMTVDFDGVEYLIRA